MCPNVKRIETRRARVSTYWARVSTYWPRSPSASGGPTCARRRAPWRSPQRDRETIAGFACEARPWPRRARPELHEPRPLPTAVQCGGIDETNLGTNKAPLVVHQGMAEGLPIVSTVPERHHAKFLNRNVDFAGTVHPSHEFSVWHLATRWL